MDGIPQALQDFWAGHGVSATNYVSSDQWRYFRVTKLGIVEYEACKQQILAQWHDAVEVGGLHGVFRIPSSCTIASSSLFREGKICGMDLSSAAVIHMGLSLDGPHHVLDLCCAPGVKMSFISDTVHKGGSVTGVDVDPHRCDVTRNLLRKFKADNVRLFRADGTQFEVLAPPSQQDIQIETGGQEDVWKNHTPLVRKRLRRDSDVPETWNLESKKSQRKKHSNDLPGLVWSTQIDLRVNSYRQYDRVLVDAECTTDGALRHHTVPKKMDEEQVVVYRTQEQVEQTCRLQKELLTNGWKLLIPGGILLYCTCSLLPCQNEEVVQSLLDQDKSAVLEPFEHLNTVQIETVESLTMPHVRYFKGSNNLFAARIRKRI